MLPVWYIITHGADDNINTPRIGNILATSCFYSGSHYEYLHRVVIACARLNEKKQQQQQQPKEAKECGRVCRFDMKFASAYKMNDNVTVAFIHAFRLKVKRQCILYSIVQGFGNVAWLNIPRKCRAFESFSVWVSFKNEIHFTRKSQTCIQTSTNVF